MERNDAGEGGVGVGGVISSVNYGNEYFDQGVSPRVPNRGKQAVMNNNEIFIWPWLISAWAAKSHWNLASPIPEMQAEYDGQAIKEKLLQAANS